MLLKDNIMKKFVLFILFCFPLISLSQKLEMRDYVVLSFQQKDIMGRDTLYWIVEMDSINDEGFKLYPIYKSDLPISLYTVDKFSAGDTIFYAGSHLGSDECIKYPNEFYDILSKNSYFIQKITKKWIKREGVYYGFERPFRRKSTVKVYVSFIRGVFLRGVIAVDDFLNTRRDYYFRTYYIPYSDFSVIENIDKDWCFFIVHHLDFSKFNYTESKAEGDLEGLIDTAVPFIEERNWRKKTK
jgi:hypothetical protein